MKAIVILISLAICSFSFGRSIQISQPLEGAVIPSSSSFVTVRGTVDSVTGGAGLVECNGKVASFSSGVNWLRGITLEDGGPNTVTCVYTKDGQTAQTTVHFTWQGNQKPIPSFSSSPNGLNLSFDATGSTDPDGSIVSYEWNFGDGTTSTGVTSSHTYSQAGLYYVDLTVTDNNGAFRKIRKSINAVSVSNTLTISSPTNNFETNVDLLTISGKYPENANKVSVLDAFGNEKIAILDPQNGEYQIEYVAIAIGINNLTVKAYNQNSLLSQQQISVIKADDSEGYSAITTTNGGVLSITASQSPLNGLVLTVPPSSISEDSNLRIFTSEEYSLNESVSKSPLGKPFDLFPSGLNFLIHPTLKVPVNLSSLPSGVTIDDVNVRALSVRTGEIEEMPILNRTSNSVTVSLPHSSFSNITTYYTKPLQPGELRLTSNVPGATFYVNGLKVSNRGDISLSDVKTGEKMIKAYREGYNEQYHYIEYNSSIGEGVNFHLAQTENNKPQINLLNISNDMEVDDNILEITGNIVFNSTDLSTSIITLVHNDRDMMLEIDEAGNFEGYVSLLPGRNTLKVRATPYNGDTATSEEYVVYNNEFKKTLKFKKLLEAGYDPAKLMDMGGSTIGGLTVRLEWNRRADIDLHLTDPDGRRAWYLQQDGIPGGEIDVDDTTGVGPEIFTMPEPRKGKYQVGVHYYHHSSNTSTPVVATVNVYLGQVLLHSEAFTLSYKQMKGFQFEVKEDLQIMSVSTPFGPAKSGEEAKFTASGGDSGISVIAEAADYITDNQITWEVFEITDGTERNLNVTGSGRGISFNASTPIPTLTKWSQFSKPLKYKIVVKANQYDLEDEFILVQDTESQVRQEYVDARRMTDVEYPSTLPVPQYADFITHTQFLGVNFTWSEFDKYSDYTGKDLMLVDQSLQMAEEVRARYGRPLIVNSAWRNPRRNYRVTGAEGHPNSVNSFHITGSGIDLKFIESNLPLHVAQKTGEARYAAWKEHMYDILCRNTANPLTLKYDVFSHGKDHIHLEPKESGTQLGKCKDL